MSSVVSNSGISVNSNEHKDKQKEIIDIINKKDWNKLY